MRTPEERLEAWRTAAEQDTPELMTRHLRELVAEWRSIFTPAQQGELEAWITHITADRDHDGMMMMTSLLCGFLDVVDVIPGEGPVIQLTTLGAIWKEGRSRLLH